MSSRIIYRRKIIEIVKLIFTSLLFVGAVSFALILAQGNMITEEGLKPTGTIRLNVDSTSGLTVLLNEQVQQIASTKTIDGILPGEYEIKITKDGYSSWQRDIKVLPGLVTEVTAQLFPESLNLEQMTANNVKQIFYAPERNSAFYTVVESSIKNRIGIWQHPLEQNLTPLINEQPTKISNLNSLIRQAAGEGDLDILPSRDGGKMLVIAPTRTFVLDTGRFNEPTVKNELKVTFPIDEIGWLRDSSNLLIRSGDILLDYDLDRELATIISFENDKSPVFASSKNSVLYIQEQKLFTYSLGSNQEVSLTNTTLPKDISQIYVSSNDEETVFLKAGETLYLLNIGENFLGVIGSYDLISISPSGRNLILRKDEEMKSARIEVNPLDDMIEIHISSSGIPSSIDTNSIVWGVTSGYFIYRKDGIQNQIFSADASGNNIATVLNSSSITSLPYTTLKDNSGLIVPLVSRDSLVNKNRVNLYKLSFRE